MNYVPEWPPVYLHDAATVGANCVFGRFTNICGGVTIGDKCHIQGFCFIPEGVTIGDRVFIGPNVTFTNRRYPKVREDGTVRKIETTTIQDDVSIGAGAIICSRIVIGAKAMIGAGSVVTKDVKPGWLVRGNPAQHIREIRGQYDK